MGQEYNENPTCCWLVSCYWGIFLVCIIKKIAKKGFKFLRELSALPTFLPSSSLPSSSLPPFFHLSIKFDEFSELSQQRLGVGGIYLYQALPSGNKFRETDGRVPLWVSFRSQLTGLPAPPPRTFPFSGWYDTAPWKLFLIFRIVYPLTSTYSIFLGK